MPESTHTTSRIKRTTRRRPGFLGAGLACGILILGGGGRLGSAEEADRITAYRDGPPPGFSGGFGEDSCHACHFSEQLNDPAGTFTVSGLPERYSPGESYRLVISLARPGMKLSGFQLAARFAEGGDQAGALAPGPGEEERVEVSTDRGVEYGYQSSGGAETEESGVARWTVLWTAPAVGGTVAIHASGNAADGDASASGDYVYTTEARILARE